jgi:hypothetical protein
MQLSELCREPPLWSQSKSTIRNRWSCVSSTSLGINLEMFSVHELGPLCCMLTFESVQETIHEETSYTRHQQHSLSNSILWLKLADDLCGKSSTSLSILGWDFFPELDDLPQHTRREILCNYHKQSLPRQKPS